MNFKRTNIKNYEILNTITKNNKKKFPYSLIESHKFSNLILTHKTIKLEYLKNKKYFMTPEESKKYEGGKSNSQITVFLL